MAHTGMHQSPVRNLFRQNMNTHLVVATTDKVIVLFISYSLHAID
jgi:hypothetical protein